MLFGYLEPASRKTINHFFPPNMSSIALKTVTDFLDGLLSVASIPDAPGAKNGLQLENNGTVSKVALAVDGSEKAIRAALEIGADLLILHHGIFWQAMQPITGIAYRKLKAAIDGNLAIYSAHLPLDIHPVYGNNALLAKACGITPCSNEGLNYQGVSLGTHGEFCGSCSELANILQSVLKAPIQSFWAKSPNEPAGDVFICTGGAGDDLVQVAELGCQTYITGEGSHWNIPLAQELGLNLIYGGHYFTETFGVKALGRLLQDVYEMDSVFIDLPPSAYCH